MEFATIKEKLNKITEMKHFDEIYSFTIAMLALLGWATNTIVGISILIVVATLMMLLQNNMKYAIPCLLSAIFCINSGFSNDAVPIPLIIVGGLFIVVLFIQVIRNGIRLNKMKYLIGISGMALANIIPILWANNIPEENSIFYVFFFTNLAYLIIYVIASSGIKGNSFKLLAHAMTYLGIALMLECLIKVIELKDTVDNILSLWYHLGWGLCNEAGIVICMALPFTFYLIGKEKNAKGIVFNFLKSFILMIGVLLTTSRGGFIFFGLEYVLLAIALFYTADNKRAYRKTALIGLGIILIICLIFIMPLIKLVTDILKYIFYNGLDNNSRFMQWEEAFRLWIENPRNIIFGPGFTALIDYRDTALGVQVVPVVFHSTLFETLTIGGLLGLSFLGIHIYKKYRSLFRFDKLMTSTMFIGFLVVDLYGLIDNTYYMYYYMVPLMIILATFDNMDNTRVECNLE